MRLTRSRLRRAPTFVIAPVLAVGLVGLPAVSSEPRPRPVPPELATVALDGVQSAAAAAVAMPDTPVAGHEHDHEPGDGHDDELVELHDAAPDPEDFEVVATSPPTDTDPFRLVAVTWQDAEVEAHDLEAWVRYRSEGQWSDWYALPGSDDHGPDPESAEAQEQRQATDPLVVPESDGVQVRVDALDGVEVDDLRVDLIDPGVSPTDGSSGSSAAGSAFAASQPTIYSRADWGADESLRSGGVQYGQIQAGFVHHTAGTNSYTSSDVPAIIRGIYAFHVKSRGWRDIGYNFVVDKYGRIWEGRYGGIAKPVIGAHTYGHNDDAFGASVLGTYTDVEPTQATLDAFARLMAWKFTLHGVDPLAKVNLDGTVTAAISGHRDTYSTACPGDRLYAKLPTVRQTTASLMSATSPTVAVALRDAQIVAGDATRLRVTTTNVAAGTSAVLKRRVEGGPWERVRVRTLDSAGTTRFRLAPPDPGAYDVRVVLRTDPVLRSAVKRLTVVDPTPSLSVALAASQIVSGQSTTISVTTSAVPGGTEAVLKRRVEGERWKRVRTATLNAAGATTFSVAPKTPREYEFRVIVRTDPVLRSAIQRLTVLASTSTTSTFVARSSDVFGRPSSGVYAMKGHGWGHGRGMSQWGANAAAQKGVREPQITSTYYPGTQRSTTGGNQIVRVLLTADTGSDVIVRAEPGLAVRFVRSDGAVVSRTLPGTVDGCAVAWWRARATSNDLAIDALCGQSWTTWRSPSRVNGNAPIVFSPTDGLIDVARRLSSGFERKGYRGAIEAHRSGSSTRAVNAVPMESYLRAVVPNEMPSSWPAEALKAQAVAARTYAMREAEDRTGYFDVYDTTASQVYPGSASLRQLVAGGPLVRGEQHRRCHPGDGGSPPPLRGRPAFTQFSSSNGGVTAAGTQPYLVRKQDDWDRAATANSRLNWTDSVSVGALERAFPSIGRLERIRVTQREGLGDWGGRILTMVLEGSSGNVTISGDSRVRSVLGTNSSYLTFG
jgi:SpoIID/LytB domain protein